MKQQKVMFHIDVSYENGSSAVGTAYEWINTKDGYHAKITQEKLKTLQDELVGHPATAREGTRTCRVLILNWKELDEYCDRHS